MDLSIIISISGKPGLYKVIGRSRTGLISESLEDQKRIPVRSTDKVSALSDISIFTYSDDLPLKEVLIKLFDHFNGEKAPENYNDSEWMAESFRKVIPEFDEDRVYTSDLKKLFKWYNLLNSQNLIDKEEAPDKEEEEEQQPASVEAEATTDVKAEEKKAKKSSEKDPAKKPAAKKVAKTKSNTAEE